MQDIRVRVGNTFKEGLLESELEEGEHLLWSGEPAPLREARQTIPLCIFGVAWTGFSVNFIYLWTNHWTKMPDIGFCLFQIPFQLIGFGTLLSPLFIYVKSKHTVYGITNKRALIIEGGRSKKVQTYGAATIGAITRVELPDGSGDVGFANESYKDSDGDSRTRKIQFNGVRNAKEVEALLRNTFEPK